MRVWRYLFLTVGSVEARTIWRRVAVVTGLSAVAFVAPLLDLYGKNPEVFVANRTSGTEIVLFGVGVALLVPLIAWGVLAVANLLGGRAPDLAYAGLVAVLALGAGFVISRQVFSDQTVLAVVLGLVVAGVVYWLVRSIDLIFVIAAVAVPVLLVMFLGTSATAKLVWEEPEVVEGAAHIGSPSQIVMLQLDEMPLASIMDTDGTINETLFPGFARLADEGTWYRNALSISIATTQSVPAILTGVKGEKDQSPSYVDHPDNLFTLVGDSYDMHVIEWVAEMCPEDTCPEYAGRSPARFSNLLRDVGVVYGHLTLPGSTRESLPSIDNSWKGFLGQEDTPSGEGVAIDGLPVPRDGVRADWVDWVQRLINGIDGGTEPTLSYAHLQAPHVPWVLNPSGTQYQRPEQYTEVEGVDGDGRWVDEPAPALLGFQRHLYQVGFLDRMITRLMDHLDDTATWDDTMVILIADHGASFVPGEHRRWPYEDNRDDLYRVPMFIKYPGQQEGETVDLPAFGIDVLPTIVDALDIDTDWQFDGESLLELDEERAHEPLRWCCNGEGVSTDLSILYGQVRRNHTWIPDQTSWTGIAAIGEDGALVGSQVTDIDVTEDDAFEWSLDLGADLDDVDRATGIVQTVLTGRVEGVEDTEAVVLFTVNDVVAGVGTLSKDSATGGTVTGLLAEDLVPDGQNEVGVLLSDGNGGWRAGTHEDLSVELVTEDGRVIELGSEGSIRLQVDSATLVDGVWQIEGWAADTVRKLTPETIYVFAGDELLYTGAPNVDNANVVRWFESEDLLRSGFEIAIPADELAQGVTRLTVVAEFEDTAVADSASLTG